LVELKDKFPDEPRAYRWFGTVCLHLKKYDKALQYYHQSIELSNKPEHKKQKNYINSIKLNIISVYRKQGKYHLALSKLSELNDKQNELSKEEYVTFIKYQTFCNQILNIVDKNYNLLKTALKKYPDCSDLYELLGHYYLNKNEKINAVDMYKLAIENNAKNGSSISENIKYYVSLAQAYSLLKNRQEIEKIRTILQTDYLDILDKSNLTENDRDNIRLVNSYLGI
jgi:tetratricopeptide (TPR) repeat protein